MLSKRFAEHDPEPWSADTKVVDLCSHLGQLAQGVLEKEGRKKPGLAAEQLGQRMATILFILTDLAQDYKIDVEQEFTKFLDTTELELGK